MRRSLVLGLGLVAAVAGPRAARANECNLYAPQTFGLELRVGCPVTVIQLGGSVTLPTFTRDGEAVMTSVAQDQVALPVTFLHYPSPTDCDLVSSMEDRTFDRYVITLPDLQPGERIAVNGQETTVLAAGDCAVVEPFFSCADPIQTCMPPGDPVDPGTDGPQDGCSASAGSAGWLLGLGVVALVVRRRRSQI